MQKQRIQKTRLKPFPIQFMWQNYWLDLLSLNISHACTHVIMRVAMVRNTTPVVSWYWDRGLIIKGHLEGRSVLYTSWDDGYINVYIYKMFKIFHMFKILNYMSFYPTTAGLKKYYVLEESSLKTNNKTSFFSVRFFKMFRVSSAYFRKDVYILLSVLSSKADFCLQRVKERSWWADGQQLRARVPQRTSVWVLVPHDDSSLPVTPVPGNPMPPPAPGTDRWREEDTHTHTIR